MSNRQILLIGDSLRLGYCEIVKKELEDCAEVLFPADNCRSSHHIIVSLGDWVHMCRPEDVVAVHFNCGQWDVAHFGGDDTSLTSLETYGSNLRKIIRRLKGYFPNAKLYFATTTPMNPVHSETLNYRTTEEICRYNRVAREVAAEYGVEVNDIFSIVEPWGENMFADYAHLTEEGYLHVGKATADFLRSRL